ncbi:MAG: undecaprenyl/decaprenyl-phosphate alpha-N-acetylglucosaminyl 1-phosphate transferase [Prevotella sp.]|nr:undecaprenyl/decaprenyl-phosphate alpha-N-acetylglucosaminyl 1-phosphate transferase [Prevotella sp.]
MVTSIVILLSTFVIAMTIGIYTIPRIVRLSHELHLYDLPDSRKVHTIPVPRLGGVAFLPTVIISIAIVVAVASRFGITFGALSEAGAPQHFVAYLAGAMMLYCLGIYDDVHGVGYKLKFAIQIFAAFLLCISGLWIASLDHIFYIDRIPYWIGMPLTVVFVVYITNAINLIDGIDGLASGLSAISLFVAIMLCMMSGDIIWAMLAIAYLGVVMTFFCFNVYGGKNKVFMGDAGSLTLGYTLSFIVLHFWQAHPVWNPYLHNIGIIILSTLIIPMLDVVRVMMSRIRDGRNPFLPDKNHIHHKLMRTGLSGRMTMLTILLISALFIVANYLVASFLSQTLMVILDILFFILMHLIINFFIRKKEKQTDVSWKRAYML